jgi:hypothetical protein
MLDGFIPPFIIGLATLGLIAIRQRYAARAPGRAAGVVTAGLVLVTVLTGILERQMGRPPTYRHGPVRLWSGDIASDQNSPRLEGTTCSADTGHECALVK